MSSHHDPARLTRRQWTAGIAGTIGAAPGLAQVTSKTPPQGAPVPAQPAATPEQKLQKAYSDVHDVSQQLSQIEVPAYIEPAFAFRP